MCEQDKTYIPSARLRDMVCQERPQERLERQGAKALSDTELLAMIIRSGGKSHDVMGICRSLIHEGRSLSGLMRWSLSDFQKIPGIGKVKALQLMTVMEISSRILIQKADESPVIDSADKVYEHMQPRCSSLDVEKFWVLCLNRKHHLLKLIEVTSGTASASLVHPREVFREAIRLGSSSVIVSHNHPSGDPYPSSADIKVTRQLVEASRILDIHLLDHIIIGKPTQSNSSGFYSFNEAGLIQD